MTSTSILAASMLALASASPMEKRIIAEQFDVSSFSVSVVPHGSSASFFFNVTTNQKAYTTTCSASFPNQAYNLPDVPFTACEDPSIIWSFQAVGLAGSTASNYTLILADAEQSLAAAKIWPASDFPDVDYGSTVAQQYTGPTLFVVQ